MPQPGSFRTSQPNAVPTIEVTQSLYPSFQICCRPLASAWLQVETIWSRAVQLSKHILQGSQDEPADFSPVLVSMRTGNGNQSPDLASSNAAFGQAGYLAHHDDSNTISAGTTASGDALARATLRQNPATRRQVDKSLYSIQLIAEYDSETSNQVLYCELQPQQGDKARMCGYSWAM